MSAGFLVAVCGPLGVAYGLFWHWCRRNGHRHERPDKQ